MNNQKNKNLIILLAFIVFILVVLIVCSIAGTFNFESDADENNNDKNITNNSNIDSEENLNNNLESATYINTIKERIKLNNNHDYYEYIDLSIENGNLIAKTSKYIRTSNGEEFDETYTSTEKTFSINGEKIKFLHYDYYQSGLTNVIFILTENGNLYVNEFIAFNQTIEVMNNFKNMNYSNVEALVKQSNENYGNQDEYGIIDYKEYYIYALINNELIKIDNQYAV